MGRMNWEACRKLSLQESFPKTITCGKDAQDSHSKDHLQLLFFVVVGHCQPAG